MLETIEVPLWKKVAITIGFTIMYAFLALMIFMVLAINLADRIPNGALSVAGVMALSLALAFPIFRWWRHQIIHKDEIVAKRLAVEEARALEIASALPRLPSAFEETIGGLFKLAGIVLVAGVVLYIAYVVIAMLPVSVAIILGAVIVGLCILAAASR